MSNADFADLINPLLKREGGYVNHPSDRGGATNHGITQRTYTAWLIDRGLGYMDVRAMSIVEAVEIYRERYWRPSMCEILPSEIRGIHFDAAINHGVRRAAMLLQESVGVKQDGVIGRVTLAAVAAIGGDLIRARYLAARYRFYGQIIRRDRSQLEFIVGWMARMEDFA